jgi:hypothetical protein
MRNNQNDSLANAVISWLIAPSFLSTAVIALYNVASKSIQTTTTEDNSSLEQQSSSTIEETDANSVVPIMSEPPPSKILVRQQMPAKHEALITEGGSMILDKDLQFISGESEMPLSVYESPVMNAFRAFTAMKKTNSQAHDGYYVVHRRRVTHHRPTVLDYQQQGLPTRSSSRLDQSISSLLKQETEEDLYGEHDDSEVMLLYGRGPTFDLDQNYANDRFEGFDD